MKMGGDIKQKILIFPQNILLAFGSLRLSDFQKQTAVRVNSSRSSSFILR